MMQTAQPGDRIQVHYAKRFQDGSVVSSKNKGPLEITVGVDDPRLPGLGLALVGLSPGQTTMLTLSAEEAYGPVNSDKIVRCSRKRFGQNEKLEAGHLAHMKTKRGQRVVRVMEVHENDVLVNANHPWAGQRMEMKVRLQSILESEVGSRDQKSAPKFNEQS